MILRGRSDVERFLRAPDARLRAALFYGRDLGVVRERAAELAGRIAARPDDPFDTALITEADLDDRPDRVEAELAALSMIGGRRLVRLRLGEGVKASRIAAEALAAHEKGQLNSEAFFLVEAGDLGRDSTLRRQAEKSDVCAVIACYEDDAGDLVRFTREALAAENLGLTAEAQQLFVARLPHERGVARQEIERLVLYLGPGSGVTAGARELEPFFGVEPDASTAEAASEAFGGRMAAAHGHLRRAAAEGADGAAAVRALSAHLARLRRIAVAQKAGASLQQALKGAQVFWKAEKEISRQARAWNLVELDVLQPEMLAADMACKQTGAPDNLIASRLAMTVAARARRLGL